MHSNMDVRLALITFAFGRLTSSQYDLGARMILDSILLALRKVTTSSTQQRDVTIIPTMIMTTGRDDVPLSHPVPGYQLRLSGIIDYVIIDYGNENKRG